MKRIIELSLAAMVTALVATQPAKAEVIDLATIKCSELATMSQEDASFLFAWLHGYYGGKAGDTTMDLAAMEAAGTTIGTYCGENPEVGILAAVEQSLN